MFLILQATFSANGTVSYKVVCDKKECITVIMDSQMYELSSKINITYVKSVFPLSRTELCLCLERIILFHPALYVYSISSFASSIQKQRSIWNRISCCRSSIVPIVNFLDLCIYLGNENTLQYKSYSKPTDSKRYLNPSSCHPRAVFDAIPFSQFLRTFRNLIYPNTIGRFTPSIDRPPTLPTKFLKQRRRDTWSQDAASACTH